MNAPADALLSVRGLSVSLLGDAGRVSITRGVSLDVARGGVTAVVGESGSGKSLTTFSILRVLPTGGRIDEGQILFEGRDLVKLDERAMRRVRGGEIGIVFQEPMTALNPVYTIGAQVVEALRLHEAIGRGAARERATDWLERVGMAEPKKRFDSYPHELSGGMRQRALLAMALAPRPKLLLLDEPTASLDRSVEAQILDVLGELRASSDLGMLFVSHDIAVVSEIADRIVVMYAGEVVEHGSLARVLGAPAHPYTQALLDTIPDGKKRPARKLGDSPKPLPIIAGNAADVRAIGEGCRFYARCPERIEACRSGVIDLTPIGDGAARCVLVAPRPSTSGKRSLALEIEPSLSLEEDGE